MAQAKQALIALLSLFVPQNPVTVDLRSLWDKHRGRGQHGELKVSNRDYNQHPTSATACCFLSSVFSDMEAVYIER